MHQGWPQAQAAAHRDHCCCWTPQAQAQHAQPEHIQFTNKARSQSQLIPPKCHMPTRSICCCGCAARHVDALYQTNWLLQAEAQAGHACLCKCEARHDMHKLSGGVLLKHQGLLRTEHAHATHIIFIPWGTLLLHSAPASSTPQLCQVHLQTSRRTPPHSLLHAQQPQPITRYPAW